MPFQRNLLRALLPVPLIAMVGCAPIQIAFGWRTRLDKTPVKDLSVQLAEGASLWPGGSAPLVVRVATEDGKELVTAGAGHGKVLWDSFRIEATGATVNGSGKVKLAKDPRAYATNPPHVRVTSISTPERSAEVDLPVRFDRAYTANFSGSSGSRGNDGLDGSTGSSGSSGSIDLNNPSPGGDGGRGGDGGNGGNGGDGGRGQDVRVFVTLQPRSQSLLQVRVESGKVTRYYLVDANGGSLRILSDGGSGGDAGRGGRGGAGGSGGMGTPSGMNGNSGSDGLAGWAGAGGDGGRITVWVDPSAKPYFGALRLSNRGGGGGGRNGPPPEIRDEPVAPLW